MKTAVIVPVPSVTITSRLGTPLRGAITTRDTSPATRIGRRSGDVAERREIETVEALLQPGPLEVGHRRPEPLPHVAEPSSPPYAVE